MPAYAKTKPIIRLTPWQACAMFTPITHFAFYGGVATGKTYTGSQFAIQHFTEKPGLTGFIGANTYDQLSQATLRELLYWLDHYKIEHCLDRIPPTEWGQRKEFKSYKNVLSVRYNGVVTSAFTRVLSDPNAVRGIEFSWYWCDETRDTPENTHDVILSRMRESDYMRGLITSTTFGEDWSYKRFVRNGDGKIFGSMHVETQDAVKAGIINSDYYEGLLRAYSPLMAEQELFAKHVNVLGGRAYYTANESNKMRIAPWGDRYPSLDRPLIVGCDFNFQPAPHIWSIGQMGPALHGPNGEWWPRHIHWFREIARSEASSRDMTRVLVNQFPEFFYRIFGDATGNRGTTSNAGATDYNQIADELSIYGANFSIDTDQANPIVRDRVENMCALFCNALGERRQTYDPDGCPNFDGDVRVVGWKKESANKGRGRLHDGGDRQRTHATDGAGYAVWKLFPPVRRASILEPVPSPLLAEVNG